jgi:hypothetical protein
MKKRTTKFFKWLIISDVIYIILLIVMIIVLRGTGQISDSFRERSNLIGQGAGRLLVIGDLVAVLIYWFVNRNKKD